jgi:hypothetical protein
MGGGIGNNVDLPTKIQTISFEIDYFTKDLSKDLCAALTEWNGCSVAYNFALL